MEISKHFRDLPQTRWLIKENPFFWSIYRGTLSEWWRAPGCCCTRRCLEDPGRRGSREPALALGGASSLVPVTWQTAEVLINCVRNAFCEFLSSVKSSKNIFLGLCSTCGQKRLRWGPQHAAVVDFAAGGRKSLRFNQESPTWARELWSNEMRATTSLTPDISGARASPPEILLDLST